jgi:hypothetical protein
MNLEKYISNLLFQQDCVIVPEFGAFIAQKVNAVYQTENSTFFPPKKELAFNPSLTKNDGLLIQSVASANGISFEKAQEEVEGMVQFWKNHLEANATLNLVGLGSFSQTETNQMIFTPANQNFLLESFGLDAVKGQFILSTESQESSSAVWWKVASIIPILIGGYLYFGKPKPVTDFVNQQWSGFVSPILNPDAKATKAVVAAPIKVVEKQISTVKEEAIIHDYQMIVGSFRKLEEANTSVSKLQDKGFTKAKMTQKKGNFYYVALETFPTKEEALEFRRTVSEEFPESWVLSLKD